MYFRICYILKVHRTMLNILKKILQRSLVHFYHQGSMLNNIHLNMFIIFFIQFLFIQFFFIQFSSIQFSLIQFIYNYSFFVLVLISAHSEHTLCRVCLNPTPNQLLCHHISFLVNPNQVFPFH